MLETRDKPKFVEHRAEATEDQPATLVELYERAARNHRKNVRLNYWRDGKWHSISSGEMLRESRFVALGLYSLGLRKGDRVALLAESCVEWVLADQGCMFAAIVPVPIYPTLTPSPVAYILNDCRARALFIASSSKFVVVETDLSESTAVERILMFQPEVESVP